MVEGDPILEGKTRFVNMCLHPHVVEGRHPILQKEAIKIVEVPDLP